MSFSTDMNIFSWIGRRWARAGFRAGCPKQPAGSRFHPAKELALGSRGSRQSLDTAASSRQRFGAPARVRRDEMSFNAHEYFSWPGGMMGKREVSGRMPATTGWKGPCGLPPCGLPPCDRQFWRRAVPVGSRHSLEATTWSGKSLNGLVACQMRPAGLFLANVV